MNFKKLTNVALVAAAIIAGASMVEAAPSLKVYRNSINISEDCSDAVISQAKADYENLKGDISQSYLSIYKVPAEEALKAIKEFSGIKKLNLSQIKITNLDFVKELPNLEELFIHMNSKDETLDISGLTDNTKLKDVTIQLVSIPDLSPLSNCTNIENLSIYMCNILNNTIKPLANLTKIKDLSLYGTNVDDFALLAPLTNMKKINVYASKANKDAELNFDHLSEIKSLEEIEAGLTKMTSVAFMKDLPKVKKISFLTEELNDYETLENCKTLEAIKYWSHHFVLDANKIGKAQSLKDLIITSCKGVVNWDGLKNLTNLEELELSSLSDNNTPDNAIDTSFLANMPKLKTVKCYEVQLKDLSKIGPSVKKVDLYKINKKDDKPFDIATLIAPEATTINIKESKVSNVESLVKNCPNVQKLTLQKLEGITNYDFLKDLPKLTNITLSKGAITEEYKDELKGKGISVSLW